jgi:hypothetical protein
MRRAIADFFRCCSGAAFIEAVLVLPIALLLTAGSVEFGRALQGYLTVEKTVRGATRYLARVPPAGVDGWGLANARNLALTGSLDGTRDYLLSHWTDPETVVLAHAPTSAAPKVSLQATVPFRFDLLPNVGLSAEIVFVIAHEERYVGE